MPQVELPPAAGQRATFETLPVIRHLQDDQACRVCGHNLITRPVRRDPRTQLLLSRCPQCRSFNAVSESPAADPIVGPTVRPTTAAPAWGPYLARSLMYLWLIVVSTGGLGVVLTQGFSTLLILELVTTHARSTVQSDSTRVTQVVWRYVPKHNLIEYKFLTYSAVVFSTGVVMTAAFVTAVVFCHWPRWGQLAFWVVEPALVAFVVCLIWKGLAPGLFTWGAQIIGLHAAVHAFGGLVGVTLGRPLVWLIARLATPPEVRSVLAHLWQPGERQMAVDAR